MFEVHISYTDSDSFSSRDCTTAIPVIFYDEASAKEAVKHITEQIAFEEYLDSITNHHEVQAKRAKVLERKDRFPWAYGEKLYDGNFINLHNGREIMRVYVFWNHTMAHFIEASVVPLEDDMADAVDMNAMFASILQ